ncbi:MAG: conjugal transfer protein TrbE, partial [Gammaproteobacteria bacterium]|nr:conjugal transfer protein TrbE [Gammaproteobacteria bacterium]
MLNLAEFRQKADRLSDLLPWAALIAPGVLLNKDGSFMQVMRYRGPDLESSTEPQLVASMARLNNALKRLGSGWAIFVEARRRHAMGYPEEGAFPDVASWLVDAERRDLFEREGEHFESDYYLTFQYLPPREAVSKLSRFFIAGNESSSEEHDYRKTLEFFISTVDRLFDIFKDFMFEVERLGDEALLTYLHRAISTKNHRIRVPENPMYLDAILADSPLTGGLSPMLGDWHIRTLSIMGFPSTSMPAILDQLNGLPM